MRRDTLARALNDVGLAAWFGVSLAAAVEAETGVAADASGEHPRTRPPWTALNLAAAAVHVAGGLLLLPPNKARLLAQRGVASTASLKSAVKVAALAATGCAGWRTRRTAGTERAQGEDGRTPRGLRLARWATAILTGTALVLNARLGEQQRPAAVLSGVVRRLTPNGIAAVLRPGPLAGEPAPHRAVRPGRLSGR